MEPIHLPFSSQDLFHTETGRKALEHEVLAAYVPGRRWFGGKARQPKSFILEELAALPGTAESAHLALIRVEYAAGPADTYLLPLLLTNAPEAEPIARLNNGFALVDALHHASFRGGLLRLIADARTLPLSNGAIQGERGTAFPAEVTPAAPSRVLSVEQSNSSVIFGDRIFLKLYRKLEDGENPDVELIRFLSEQRHFTYVPPFCGAIEFQRPGREPQVLALALGLVANQGDAWAFTLSEVAAAYGRVLDKDGSGLRIPPLLSDEPDPQETWTFVGSFAARAHQLGVRTGQMHLALASEPEDPAFSPQPFGPAEQAVLSTAVGQSVDRMTAMLHAGTVSGEFIGQLNAVIPEIRRRGAEIATHPVQALKIRTHGDYHLGQVLNTGTDFIIIDFEGEPQRSLAARKEKQSPLRDLAGMLRSFHYAAHCELMKRTSPEEQQRLSPWAECWAQCVGRAFLRGWLETTHGATFVPLTPEELVRLLEAFLLEKAVYEVCYELNNRPDWVKIPVQGILGILHPVN